MRTIIAGSRSATRDHLIDAMYSYDAPITVVLCGGAAGADTHGADWARSHSIPVEMYPADWDRHGKRAGIVRNCEMAARAEALLAIWDGESRGTAHMIGEARRRGLRVTVHCTGARVVFDNLIGHDDRNMVRHFSRHARAMRDAHHWLDVAHMSERALRTWADDRPSVASGEINT